jgi:hypothetical protein
MTKTIEGIPKLLIEAAARKQTILIADRILL